jgi:hypothetical protein
MAEAFFATLEKVPLSQGAFKSQARWWQCMTERCHRREPLVA